MIFNLIFLILILSIIKAFFSIFSVKKTIRLLTEPIGFEHMLNPPDIVIVIPVLREQKIIKETIDYFRHLDCPKNKFHLLIVTTQKEYETDQKISTINIIDKLKNKYSSLKTLHQPKLNTQKSDQLNYAVENFNKIFPELNPENTFFAFYDADSRPNRNVLKVFNSIFEKNKKAHIFQQSANYLANFSEFDNKNFFERNFLKAQALKQTRFSLAYEIPRILRVYNYTSGKNKSLVNKITYAPTIAHGLFVRVAFLQKVKFPSRYTPEDMFWGFLVSAMDEPIVFIPSLDNSETPANIKNLFLQLASWFKGPALISRYRNYLKQHYSGQYNKAHADGMTIFALADAGNWLLTSIIVYLGIIGSLIFGLPIFLLFLLFLSLYQFSILIIIKRYLNLNNPKIMTIMFFGVIIMMFHSLPALFSLSNLILKKTIYHKTER